MSLVKQLLLNEEFRVIGLLGGKGRNYLTNELAGELAREGKRVVITHLEAQMLPTSGKILFEKNKDNLLKKINTEIKKNPIIYTGLNLEEHLMVGIEPAMVKKIVGLENVDYVLLILGTNDKVSIFTKKQVSVYSKLSFLDQMIYCFQLDYIDGAFTGGFMADKKDFLKYFPKYQKNQVVRHELIVDYLSDDENGINKLFHQTWPCILVFTDITNLLLENKVINLSRDLFSQNFTHLYQANFRENIIKPVSAK